jgi:hypothetical protein
MNALQAPGPELTPELAAQLLAGARSGLFKDAVAEGAGIPPSQLDEYLRMGLAPGAVEPYRTFARAYRSAEKVPQLSAVNCLLRASESDPKVALAFLAARYPDEWGPKATKNRQAGDLQPSEADVAAETEMVRQLVASRPPVLEEILRAAGWTPPVEGAKPSG